MRWINIGCHARLTGIPWNTNRPFSTERESYWIRPVALKSMHDARSACIFSRGSVTAAAAQNGAMIRPCRTRAFHYSINHGPRVVRIARDDDVRPIQVNRVATYRARYFVNMEDDIIGSMICEYPRPVISESRGIYVRDFERFSRRLEWPDRMVIRRCIIIIIIIVILIPQLPLAILIQQPWDARDAPASRQYLKWQPSSLIKTMSEEASWKYFLSDNITASRWFVFFYGFK